MHRTQFHPMNILTKPVDLGEESIDYSWNLAATQLIATQILSCRAFDLRAKIRHCLPARDFFGLRSSL